MSSQMTLWDMLNAISLQDAGFGATPSVSPDGPTIGPSGQEARPASLFRSQDSERGTTTPDTLPPAWLDLVHECAPVCVFGEQVAAAVREGWLDALQDELEAHHYAVGACSFPACSVGSPHIRQRLYFGAVRLADACGAGSQGRDGMPKRAAQQTRGVAGGVEHHQSDGREPWRAEPSGRGATSGRASGRLADAVSERREGIDTLLRAEDSGRDAGALPQAAGSGPTNGFWRDADWLYCRDGKWRPVEPGTFPLADGASARVVRLHCYGDGIVAQQAATFIEEFRAVTEEANASTILGE